MQPPKSLDLPVSVEPSTTQSSALISMPLQGEQIKLAQRLIYQTFIEEIGWIPDRDNPSGIQVIHQQNDRYFVDAYDQVARWFGTFHRDRLIACWRFCAPLDGKFELEHYHPIPEFLKTSRSLEITRLVVHPQYRTRSRVMLHLTQATYQHLCPDYDYTFAAVEFPYPGDLYLKLGAKKLTVPPFKYSPTDRNTVEMIALDFQDKTTVASGYSRSRSS